MTRGAFEPILGLPGVLPRGERILWQGRPDWRTLARTALFGNWVALWFGGVAVWRVADGLSAGAQPSVIFAHTAALLLMAAITLALIVALAIGIARTTRYTVTNRRVAMKIGVALNMTLNVPFRQVTEAALRPLSGGRGDIALGVGGEGRFAYLLLWPHARPWRLARPQPMLRALPDAAGVARLLGEALAAWQAEHGAAPAPDQTAAAPTRVRTARAPAAHAALTPAE